ncbi:hypothetical protein ACWGKQ_07950 [Streptomyces sp. NPDC054770]
MSILARPNTRRTRRTTAVAATAIAAVGLGTPGATSAPFIAGGAIIVDTGLLAPCTGGPNGYARAYDSTTDKWSPRVPVTVCNRYD